MKPAPQTTTARLTAREIEIVEKIAAGLATKDIAEALGITFKTVVTHRSHIMRKLNANNAASLVRIAIAEKYIRP